MLGHRAHDRRGMRHSHGRHSGVRPSRCVGARPIHFLNENAVHCRLFCPLKTLTKNERTNKQTTETGSLLHIVKEKARSAKGRLSLSGRGSGGSGGERGEVRQCFLFSNTLIIATRWVASESRPPSRSSRVSRSPFAGPRTASSTCCRRSARSRSSMPRSSRTRPSRAAATKTTVSDAWLREALVQASNCSTNREPVFHVEPDVERDEREQLRRALVPARHRRLRLSRPRFPADHREQVGQRARQSGAPRRAVHAGQGRLDIRHQPGTILSAAGRFCAEATVDAFNAELNGCCFDECSASTTCTSTTSCTARYRTRPRSPIRNQSATTRACSTTTSTSASAAR